MPLTPEQPPRRPGSRRGLWLLVVPPVLLLAAAILPVVRPVELNWGSFHLVAGFIREGRHPEGSGFYAYRETRHTYTQTLTRRYALRGPLTGFGVRAGEHVYFFKWFAGTDLGSVRDYEAELRALPPLPPPP